MMSGTGGKFPDKVPDDIREAISDYIRAGIDDDKAIVMVSTRRGGYGSEVGHTYVTIATNDVVRTIHFREEAWEGNLFGLPQLHVDSTGDRPIDRAFARLRHAKGSLPGAVGYDAAINHFTHAEIAVVDREKADQALERIGEIKDALETGDPNNFDYSLVGVRSPFRNMNQSYNCVLFTGFIVEMMGLDPQSFRLQRNLGPFPAPFMVGVDMSDGFGKVEADSIFLHTQPFMNGHEHPEGMLEIFPGTTAQSTDGSTIQTMGMSSRGAQIRMPDGSRVDVPYSPLHALMLAIHSEATGQAKLDGIKAPEGRELPVPITYERVEQQDVGEHLEAIESRAADRQVRAEQDHLHSLMR